MKRMLSSTIAPWSGLIAGMAGEGLHHQVLADLLHFDCRQGGALPGLAWGAGLVVLIAFAAALSRASVRTSVSGTPYDNTRRFISNMSLMAAAFFSLAITWQTIAGFIVPSCPT
jgi:hypothetical protein